MAMLALRVAEHEERQFALYLVQPVPLALTVDVGKVGSRRAGLVLFHQPQAERQSLACCFVELRQGGEAPQHVGVDHVVAQGRVGVAQIVVDETVELLQSALAAADAVGQHAGTQGARGRVGILH